MRSGSIMGELSEDELSEENIMFLAAGIESSALSTAAG